MESQYQKSYSLGMSVGYFVEKMAKENPKKIDRFQRYYTSIEYALTNDGHTVNPGNIFNSGYEGFTFFINGVKGMVIEQSGAVGLEDHSEGYLEVIVGNQRKIMFKHSAKRFGDTRLNEVELEWIEENLWEEVINLFLLEKEFL